MLRSEDRMDRIDAFYYFCRASHLKKVSGTDLAMSGIAGLIVANLSNDDDDIVKGAVMAVLTIQMTDRFDAFKGCELGSALLDVSLTRSGKDEGALAALLLLFHGVATLASAVLAETRSG